MGLPHIYGLVLFWELVQAAQHNPTRSPHSINHQNRESPILIKSNRVLMISPLRFVLLFLFWLVFLPQKNTAQNFQGKIDSLLTAIQFSKEDSGRVKSCLLLSKLFCNTSRYPEALTYADSAIITSQKLGFQKGEGLAYNNIGIVYFNQGDYFKALQYYEAARKIFEEIDDPLRSAMLYNNIGIILSNQGHYTDALQNYTAGLELYREIKNKRGIALSLSYIGSLYRKQGNYSDALKNYHDALKTFEEIGDYNRIAESYNNIAIILQNQGNYPDALAKFMRALKIAEEIGDKVGASSDYNNIGTVYNDLSNYDEALKYYFTSLRVSEEAGYKAGIGLSTFNIAEVYTQQGNYAEAMHYYLASLAIYEDLGSQVDIADIQDRIGRILQKQGDVTGALEKFRSSLMIYEEAEHAEGITTANLDIGKNFLIQAKGERDSIPHRKYKEAISYLQKGLILGKKIGYQFLVVEGYEGLAEAYRGLSDYKTALEYEQLRTALKDSILSNETTRKLEQLRTQYEVEKAITAEKVKQDSLLAEQKWISAKEQAELQASHALAIAKAKAEKEKAVELARIRYQMDLAAAKTEQEKELATQQFQSELQLAEENSRHQLALAEQKARELTAQAARKHRNEIILSTLALVGLISVFLYLLNRQRHQKQKAIEKAETQHKMSELELQSLRAQLNPHFMFNSLNAIQELILKEENDKSHTYLARFAKLLRMLLENANSPFIPLARELEFLQLYLSLEKLRIPDLKYTFEVDPGINTEQVKIPNMILQPYIENAIWHGLSHKKEGDRSITIRVHNDRMAVHYEIEDNGVGRKRAEELKSLYRKEHRSKGMELLTKRFKLLNEEYQSHIETSVDDVEQNQMAAGTRISIRVPWDIAGRLQKSA